MAAAYRSVARRLSSRSLTPKTSLLTLGSRRDASRTAAACVLFELDCPIRRVSRSLTPRESLLFPPEPAAFDPDAGSVRVTRFARRDDAALVRAGGRGIVTAIFGCESLDCEFETERFVYHPMKNEVGLIADGADGLFVEEAGEW